MSSNNWLDALLESSQGRESAPTGKVIENSGIVLFGAGNGGETAIRKIRTVQPGTTILDIFDNDPKKWGTRCMDMTVKSPAGLDDYGPETIVLVTSMYFAEIAEQVRELGFERVYDYHMLFPVHSDYFFERNIIEEARSDIERLEAILEDEQSKTVLQAILEYRLTLQSSGLLLCRIQDQYFPADIVALHNDEVFVDAGAFIGSTTLEFAQRVKQHYQKIICFEPDAHNFMQLETNLKAYRLPRVQAWNFGVYDSKGELTFASDDEACSSSHITDNGKVTIRTITIDEALSDEAVSFIKMDIEGAEIAALKGAEQTITRRKPTLAVSVYHTPTDLWQIPLMLKALVPDYRIYLRNHSRSLLETVCYAVHR
jgi:FkbM family methyltransferase